MLLFIDLNILPEQIIYKIKEIFIFKKKDVILSGPFADIQSRKRWAKEFGKYVRDLDKPLVRMKFSRNIKIGISVSLMAILMQRILNIDIFHSWKDLLLLIGYIIGFLLVYFIINIISFRLTKNSVKKIK
jgi:hypothetical protein